MDMENTEFSIENRRLKVVIKGDIDHHSAKTIREKIDNQIFSYKPNEVILDLSKVEFMDSSGLGLIMGRYTTSKEIGAELVILKPSYKVKKILELAGIERIIEIKGDDLYAKI
jgi:stage II sporulation protein AA (anti-sigma F factor antagonist)